MSDTLEYFDKMCKSMALTNTSAFPEVQKIRQLIVDDTPKEVPHWQTDEHELWYKVNVETKTLKSLTDVNIDIAQKAVSRFGDIFDFYGTDKNTPKVILDLVLCLDIINDALDTQKSKNFK